MRRVIASFAVVALLAACAASDEGISVTDARIGQPTGPNAALYLVVSGGAGDRLVAATTDVASRLELHETIHSDDGTMSMAAAPSFEVDEEGLSLTPGGKHVMLIEADRMDVGQTVEVVLTFEQAGEVEVTAEVVAPEDVMAEGHDHDDH